MQIIFKCPTPAIVFGNATKPSRFAHVCTTLYYKACTKYFPVVLCTTKLAQSTLQYYFVLQSLHKALPSTTLYYKACTKHVPVLLRDTKLAQRKLLHTASSFAEKLLHTASFLNREAVTQREAFTHNKLLHREAFTHSKLLHTTSFTHSKLLQKQVFTQRSFLVHNHNRHCSSKTGSRRQSEKKTILKHFLKGIVKGKLLARKLGKSADKPLSQPSYSHSNNIYEIQLQKTIVLRMQPRHQATLTQPLQCDLHRLSCKTQ